MTSERSLRKLLVPTLRCFPEIIYRSRYLCFTPIRNFMFTVHCDRTSDETLTYVRVSIIPIFVPLCRIFIGEIRYEKHPESGEALWTESQIHQDLTKQVSTRMLPQFLNLETFDDYYNFCLLPNLERNVPSLHPLYAIAIRIAAGHRADAIKSYAHYLGRYTDEFIADMPPDIKEFILGLRALKPLLEAGERDEIAKTLHHWEVVTLTNFKLIDYYEPTPFPLETHGWR